MLRLLRLFHVEDSSEVRALVARELAEIEGLELVGSAGSAAEAIRQIRALAPDLVALDLRLAEGNGIDVLRALATNADPIIFLAFTNHSDAVSRETARKAGAAYFFDKSKEFDQFLAKLRELVGQIRTSEE